MSLRAMEDDTSACARKGSTVGKGFSYIGYVLFFVILVMCEFDLVHNHMKTWSDTFVFYIVFFYCLTELLINLLVSIYSCLFRGATFCGALAIRTRSQMLLITLNSIVHFFAISMRMFLMLLVAVNIIGLVMPLLYFALFISTRLVLPPQYLELRWISPHKTIRVPRSFIFLLLFVLCALIVYVKNDNVYAKSWSVLGVAVWLFAECWTFVLTHMMEHSMSNMARVRCGLCWSGSNSTGYRIVGVGSDEDAPSNINYIAISTYRAIMGT